MISVFSTRQPDFPLSFSLLLSLLVVYGCIIVLHFSLLPVWMLVFCVGIMVWRINILREKWRAPERLLKILMMSLVSAGLFFQYTDWLSVKPMVALLITALSLKLLEIRYRRDYLLIIFLSYFVIACCFLFDQSVVVSGLGLLATVITTAALLQLYCLQSTRRRVLRLSMMMLLQSSVLMVVMTLVFPRIPPLWSVPLTSGSAISGVGDSMSPGDFDQLIRSNEPALRMTFLDEPKSESSSKSVLAASHMYWRGVVFDDFDGRRWQRYEPVLASIARLESTISETTIPPAALVGSQRIQYDVVMEASGQHWLFGLSLVQIQKSNAPLIYTGEQEVLQKTAVYQRQKYRAVSYLNTPYNGQRLSENERYRLTQLPTSYNPKAQVLAKQWRGESQSDTDYIEKVLTFYRQNFTYTLSPPKLGRHTVDEFLFSTQLGFCEHFSSSFVVLMRSAGIPSRIVVGYQGGTWSADNDYLTVFQRDAHAWTEVWLEGLGWVRVDPTAAVAAIRIEQGLAAALSDNERIQLDTGLDQYRWLSGVYQQWLTIDFEWQQWVLSYDNKQQQSMLSQYFGDITPLKLALVFFIPLLFVVLLISFSLFRHMLMPVPKEVTLHRQLIKKLQRLGVEPQAGEPIQQYCARAAIARPQLQPSLEQISMACEQVLYNDGDWLSAQKAVASLKSH